MHWNSYFIFCSEKAFNFLLSFLAITSFRNLANAISLESNSQKNSKTNSATNAKLNHKLQWTVIIFLGVISRIIILPGNSINFSFITLFDSAEIYLTWLNILCKYMNKVVIIIQTFHVIHCKILPHLEIWSMQIIVNRKSIPRVIPSIIPCKPNSVYPFQKTWKAPITEVEKFHWNIISMEAYLFKYINEVWFSLEKKKKCADTRFWNCMVRYKF